ncbi:unnamed protein product [Chrysoparadoxa australica]
MTSKGPKLSLIAGSYEGFCHGWEVEGEGDRANLSFAYKTHQGVVKSLAVVSKGPKAGKLLVTGGVDERIRIYDLASKMESGELNQHSGTVTCLEFCDSTHLLSGSEDSTICIWRVHDWALLHVLGGHKSAVHDLSIHPSGRLALSVSKDRTLRLWNLLEGRSAYIKRLQGEGMLVRWSPEGSRYAVALSRVLQIYDASTCEVVQEATQPMRINAMEWVQEDALVTCSDDRQLRVVSVTAGELTELAQSVEEGEGTTGRLRAMAVVQAANGDEGGHIVTATSGGRLHVWSMPVVGGEGGDSVGAEVVATVEAPGGPRFTCVGMCRGVVGVEKARKKRKRAQKAGGLAAQVEEEPAEEKQGQQAEGAKKQKKMKQQQKQKQRRNA